MLFQMHRTSLVYNFEELLFLGIGMRHDIQPLMIMAFMCCS